MMVRIGLFGARGRMGSEIIGTLDSFPGVVLSSAFERGDHPDIGVKLKDGVELASDSDLSEESADVFIDFTNPSAALSHIDFCARHGKPIVVGTTGFSRDEEDFIVESSRNAPILLSPNMSFGVNVLFEVLRIISPMLRDYDVEIVEAHHRHKKDSPSGTALRLGRIVAESWGKELEELEVYRGRGAIGERPRGVIGFSVIRAGDIVGDHKVVFCGSGECLEFSHRALSRRAFAVGALKGAVWLSDKPPGLYSMRDVLGITH